MSQEPWLGDALRALDGLAADAEATEGVLRLLGLTVHATQAAVAALAPAPARGDFTAWPQDFIDEPGPETVAASAASRPDTPPPGDAGRRLPSRFDIRPAAASAPPPVWLSSVAPLVLPSTAPRHAPLPALLPRQRRRAVLTTALAVRVAEGPPDMRRIVAELGRCRPLRSVPRRLCRTLRYGVDLRIDRAPWLRPFHDDQMQLREALLQLMPRERVLTTLVDGSPQPLRRPVPAPQRRAAPGQAAAPGPLTPVLWLSDLGFGYRPMARAPAPWAEWQASLSANLREGRAVVVLTPLPAAAPPRLPGLAWLHWSERTTLGDAARARAGQQPPPVHPATDEELHTLARGISPALVASPALLRETRLALHLAPAAEAELSFGPWVQSFGREGLVLQPEAAMALRRELAQSGTLQASLDRVARTQGGTADGSAIEEALIALELRGRLDDASAEEALRSALAALAQGGDTAAALAPWAAHAWSRMSPAARVTTAARQLAYAAAGHAAHAGWLADPVAGQPALPAPADWLFAAAEQRVALSAELRRFADGTVNLVLGPEQPATQALHRLELPAGRPLWLRVRSGEAAAQTVEVDPGQLTQVDIGSYALDQPVELHTLQGEAVALTGTTLVAGLRGVILGAGFMEWVAVVLDGGVAVALPVVQPKTVPKLGDMLELREPEAGWIVPARVLGVASASNGGPLPGALALELTRREGRALALDFQVSLPQPGPAGSGAFVSLGFGKPQPEKPVSKNADGGWVANSALVPPGLLAEAGPQGSWSVVPGIDNSTSPPSLRTVPMAALRDWARHCVASQTLYLVLSAGVEGTAQALHKALARRLGDWRVADQGDIRLLTWTERDWAEAAPRTLVVVVGVSAPDASVQGLLQRAVAAGCDLLWVPLHSDAERVLALWPKALAETMATSQQVGQGYWSDPVRLAEYVASISPAGRKGDRRPAPASPATSARGAPAPQAPRGSLRARFVALVENREDQDLGLFRIAAEQGWSLVSADRLPAAQPLLLFIHGIAGDTKTNFGALLCEPNAERERLARAYPGAIFTWHYRSITQGPLANAVALLKAVPARARLHLVSYSGGGVIAELLCRGMREGTAVDERDVALMGAAAERGSAEPQHQALLGELAALLAERAAQIERFVRIAAPIEGSGTRADGGGTRLTQTLPFFGGLLSALPGVDAFLSDASLVPGSASLAPGAGVQALLTRSVRVHAPLTVIAGMSRPGGSVLARAGTWLARSLGTEGTAAATEGSGDGWVSLASAFGGMERAGGVDYLIEEGEDIAHAGYMQLPRLRRALVDALLAQALPAPGFAHASTLAELQQRFTPPAA